MNAEYRAYVEVNLKAIFDNVNAIKKRVPHSDIMAVVKGDAYGHGAVAVSRAIERAVHSFGVAILAEGVELRDAGISKPILVMGNVDACDYRTLITKELSACVFNMEQIKALDSLAARLKLKAHVHVAVDTGMSRLGFDLDNAALAIKTASKLKHTCVDGVYSHLTCAEAVSDSYTSLQVAKLLSLKLMTKGFADGIKWHIANSAGAVTHCGYNMDIVRLGIQIYGLYPRGGLYGAVSLTPALSLKSKLVAVRAVRRGTRIGYGSFVAVRDTKVGVVPIGYADGYSRAYGKGGYMLVNGERAPVLGSVCMDMLMVDVTDINGAIVGSEVVAIGSAGDKEISADFLAECAGTINYEVVTRISSRVPRTYVGYDLIVNGAL